jgi:arginyl-tRNA synthetase
MSKRRGQFITMDALIDEVGADVAKYIFLTRKPNSHLDFDLDLAKEQSDENPVMKVKYAHARICSLLTKAEQERGVDVGEPTAESLAHLDEEPEWNLVRELIRLPRVVVSAARTREPHRLTAYVDEVASLYNRFWNQCEKILEQDDERRLAQLHLSLITRRVIRVVCELIGVDAPEAMEKRD